MCIEKVVYRHRRLDNNKVFYIGIGNEKRPYYKKGRNIHWKRIVAKTDYAIEILSEGLSLEDACELEMFLISEYGKENLSNINSGGEGQFNPDAQTRYKIGTANRGKKHSKERRLKISEGNKGKTYSKESLYLMSLNSGVAKWVVDLQTGIFYHSLRYACDINNISYKAEHLRITRYNKDYRFKYLAEC